nr:ribonuclease domain-containing protein [Xanthomonas translucens]
MGSAGVASHSPRRGLCAVRIGSNRSIRPQGVIHVSLDQSRAACRLRPVGCAGSGTESPAGLRRAAHLCARSHARCVRLHHHAQSDRRLPQAGRGQTYYEGKARRDPGGPAGTYRLVYLVTDGAKKSVIDKRYYSADHYLSFCTIP